jgi:carboxylesterase
VTDDGVDASAFDLVPDADVEAQAQIQGAGASAPAAALCLHGLTGTPYEVRPIARALAARGIRARGPALPGHDTTPEDLSRVPYTEWVAAARGEVEKLRGDHERVFIAGVSMGGLVALALAAEGLCDALAVIGVPLRLRTRAAALVPLAKYVHGYLPKRDGSDIQDPVARGRHPGYKKMPLRSVHELMKLQRHVVPRLARVSAPILVAHGAFDGTAHSDDAHRIAGEVSSDERRLLLLERSGHVVTVDHDGEHLANSIAAFFLRPRSSAR